MTVSQANCSIFYSRSETETFVSGSPKRVKILDFQGLTLGHPAMDIWTIVYSATDPEYRADHLDNDLQAYHAVFSSYLDSSGSTVDYDEFRKEVDERRIYGMVMFSKFAAAAPIFTISLTLFSPPR